MLATELRTELKAWERSFLDEYGRKPSREDIKKHPLIEAKYKSYNHATRPPASKSALLSPRLSTTLAAQSDILRERPGNIGLATPRKSHKHDPTTTHTDNHVEPDPTPAFIRCALGPTPQKDGQALGIFDMLPSASPCKVNHTTTLNAASLQMTPTKPMLSITAVTPLSSHTPTSSKRKLLDAFTAVTPKRKRGDETPSTARRSFATPSFLRRSAPLASIDEMAEFGTLVQPFKKRGVLRSLSSIIQGLRSQEEERLDEELDILNELEAEEFTNEKIPFSQPAAVQVMDSQAPDVPLGPDRPANDGSLDANESRADVLDASGNVRKPYRKKGLKRQTKRVNMRPVMHQPRKEADVADRLSSDDQQNVIAETQLDQRDDNRHDEQDDSQASDDDDGDASAVERPPKVGTTQTASDKPKSLKKKISAQAHANFRRLKIKNKNSKANGRGRFRR